MLVTDMLKPCLATTLLLFALAAGGQEVLGEREFSQRFIDHLQSQVPDVKIDVVDPLTLSIESSAGSDDRVLFLDNAYRSYLQAPEELAEIVAQYADGAVEPAQAPSEPAALSRIVPVIKRRDWLQPVRSILAERGTGEMPEYAHVTLNDELIVVYAEDTPSNIRYLTKDSLAKLPVALEELGPLAIENLLGILPEASIVYGDGLYLVMAGGNYEASLLLHDDMWADGIFAVTGEIVVGVPARDVLLVTGTGDSDSLRRARALVEKNYAEGIYALSPELFVRRGGRWEIYYPDCSRCGHEWARSATPQSVQKLFDNGVSPDGQSAFNVPLLFVVAMHSSDPEVAQIFFEEAERRGTELVLMTRLLGSIQNTALHAAARNDAVGMVKFFLAKGMDPQLLDGSGKNALQAAPGYNENPEVYRALLEAGIDPNNRDYYSWTVLHGAARFTSNLEVFEVLVGYGGNVNARTDNGVTPLGIALQYREPRIAEFLRTLGATDKGTRWEAVETENVK